MANSLQYFTLPKSCCKVFDVVVRHSKVTAVFRHSLRGSTTKPDNINYSYKYADGTYLM